MDTKFHYKVLENLIKTDLSYLSKLSGTALNLCIYEVVESKNVPFLKFMLQRNLVTNQLEFPIIPFSDKFILDDDIFFQDVKEYVRILFLMSFIELDIDNIVVNGLYENDETYIFIDITKCKLDIYDIYKKNVLWFCLLDEIVNVFHVCNIVIHPSVSDFFVQNSDFLFLYDNDENKHEIPVVSYVGREINKLTFTYVFGVSKEQNNMGSYYYFTDFKNAARQACILDGKSKKGVVRFAIFLGKSTLNLHSAECFEDLEEGLKKEMENDTWTEETCDSACLPNFILDNSVTKGYTYVLTNYNQQHPLSYHYLDKLPDVFHENDEYHIM